MAAFGTQIITDLEGLFYLLHLLNLREALAAWLGFVAHRLSQIWKDDNNYSNL